MADSSEATCMAQSMGAAIEETSSMQGLYTNIWIAALDMRRHARRRPRPCAGRLHLRGGEWWYITSDLPRITQDGEGVGAHHRTVAREGVERMDLNLNHQHHHHCHHHEHCQQQPRQQQVEGMR